jgi:hypothetical protein
MMNMQNAADTMQFACTVHQLKISVRNTTKGCNSFNAPCISEHTLKILKDAKIMNS